MRARKGEELLRVREIARRAGVSARTVRFYVNLGLLPKPLKTHRNMAYYDQDFIPKIKAIKKAQAERFLPLVAIKRMLEENGYDYAALSVQEPPLRDELESKPRVDEPASLSNQIPKQILKDLAERGWISLHSQEASPDQEGDQEVALEARGGMLLDFLAHCHQKGLSWTELEEAFETICGLTEKSVECEVQVLLSRLADEGASNFEQLIDWERRVVRDFVSRVRERALARILRQRKQILDNTFLAMGDEGFGLPWAVIQDDLKSLEASLAQGPLNLKQQIDLATGYSCVGDLDKAMELLRRVLEADPKNVEAQVRLCWYQRLSESGPESMDDYAGRDSLARIVASHPQNMMGRIFLALWYACDSHEAENSAEALRLINQALNQLKAAEELRPPDFHMWVLINYAKGAVFASLLPSLGEQAEASRALRAILNRGEEVDAYYAHRMPFFPKWLWPNVLGHLGAAELDLGRFEEAKQAFEAASRFRVSRLFREQVEAGIETAIEGLRSKRRRASG